MPTPSRVLTNNYQDCQLIKMDLDDSKSPLTHCGAVDVRRTS
jgi:hypothetical protein